MNWQQAEELMESRGYSMNGVARFPGSGTIAKKVFSKKINNLTFEATVTCIEETCDNCWKVKIQYHGLKLLMDINSKEFSLTSASFNLYERVVSLYADHLRNFDPLKLANEYQ